MLPPDVSMALQELANGVSKTDLAKRSSSISTGYKQRENSASRLLTEQDALAYALARMPATYGASRRAMVHLKEAVPQFEPHSVLDVGCGPGTASFAASLVFPSTHSFVMQDRNGPFLDLARMLTKAALPSKNVTISATDLQSSPHWPATDLVLASYVLAELSPSLRKTLLCHLWSATVQVLLLVEPGTPDGFQRLRDARQLLQQQGAFTAAPCVHEAICPMNLGADHSGKWCRFSERVQRSKEHRFLKSAERSFEDEPFSYLAMVRAKPDRLFQARVVGPAAASKFEITLPVCCEQGLETLKAPRRNKEKYKSFKRKAWGDAVETLV
jgi:ribosomal protein RSM22 (predicted rRNA methylase)